MDEEKLIREITESTEDLTLESRIKLGAYFRSILYKGEYKKNYSTFLEYVSKTFSDVNAREVLKYMRFYCICAYLDITLFDLEGISWSRIKLFMKYIDKNNKGAILAIAKTLPPHDYAEYMAPQGFFQFFLKNYVGEKAPLINEKIRVLLEDVPLDAILQYLAQKYPHVLIEVTEIECSLEEG